MQTIISSPVIPKIPLILYICYISILKNLIVNYSGLREVSLRKLNSKNISVNYEISYRPSLLPSFQNTGFISLVTSFDFEQKTKYKLKVKATDKGVPERSAIVTVNIDVTNVDEKLSIGGPYTVTIPENHGPVNKVVQVTASDSDNASITFSIMGNSPFSISQSTGVITVSGTIHREATVHSYVLTVKASTGIHTVQTTVTIDISDVNDNVPTFSPSEYTANLKEHSPGGTNVNSTAAVADSDKDATSPNNVFTFSIDSGNTNDAFKIDKVRNVNRRICFWFDSVYWRFTPHCPT